MAAFTFRREALVWTPAWLTLCITGALELLARGAPAVGAVASFTATLFPFLMLVGALRFTKRSGHKWVLAVGLVAGSVRLLMAAGGLATAAQTMALVVDPLPLLAAATITLGYATRRRPLVPDILVGPGLLLLTSVEAYSGYRELVTGNSLPFSVWIAFVLPAAIGQFYATIAESERARAAADRALEANEARFQLITENSLDLISELGPDGKVVYASPNHRLAGLDPDEIVGKRVEELAYLMEGGGAKAESKPSDGARRYEALGKARLPDGEMRWFESRSTATVDEFGNHRVVSISRDVTDRVRAEESLRKSRERIRTLVASLPKTRVTVIARDLTVHSLVPEDGEAKHHGITRGNVAGEKVDRFVGAHDARRWETVVAEVLESGETRELRQEVKLAEATLWFDTFLSPVVAEEQGENDLVLAVSRDVTDQVEAELERREFELRREQAQKFESLGLLASGIAHDFNNLLVGISGNVELAQRSVPEESGIAPRLRDIAKASRRAAELTEQLLAYSGKADLKVEPLDLADLVEETVQVLRGYGRSDADILVEPSEPHPWISGDKTQVGQVVMNLVTNAAEAVADRGGRIIARTGCSRVDRDYLDQCHPGATLEPGDYAFVEIEDNGRGLTREALARAFEPFYSSHGLGRGLGLATVLGIVRSHGGTIRVESDTGRGTRFRVLFLPTEPQLSAGAPETAPPPPRSSGTVLVVDDEDSVRRVAREFLELAGFDVVEASRGAEAIELVRDRTSSFRAALLDVSMPEMDGAQTLAGLRRLRGDLPVVFMSGHSATDLGRIDEGSARTARVRKPFGINDLRAALRSVIGA